jgi:hypothetical protein
MGWPPSPATFDLDLVSEVFCHTTPPQLTFSPQDPDVRLRAALVYNHFGDTDRSIEWLQKARAAGTSASLIRGTPDFDHLSGDLRLQAILR